VQFVGDAGVDGTATWRPATGAVSCDLTVRLATGAVVPVRLSWTQAGALATARVGAATLTLPTP